MSIAHNIEDKVRTDDVHISESIDFTGLLLSPPILDGLTKSGFKRPSPIQLQAIPLGRCGLDLIVQAKSGTGKTCVFTVIALEGLNLQTDALQVLILAPTREIAIQIREVVNSIGSCMPELKCHSFIGGTSVQQDKISLKRCHIATGTPGRIKQLIEIGMLKTQSIRLFVLDEADKLLGGDLTETINWIYSSLPDNKQILALSATYPETLAQHLTRYMRNPTFVRLNITDPALIGIKQYHVIVPDSPLPNKVFQAKTEAVIRILSSVSFEQCLIFSNLQTRAQSLQSELQARNWPTQCIAGCLDQKDRSLAMEHLKTYKCRILISTDLTSRGIDADKVNMVINLDVPLDHETYLHRIGRAGRFGSHGAAISIVSKGKQEKELWAVERKCKTHIPKLPDPIPSDLATRYIPLNLKLSDVVSTERIITQADSLMESSQPASVQSYLGSVEARYKEISEICDTHREMEEERNHKIDLDDRVEESIENRSDQDAVSIDDTHEDNDENLVHISKTITEGSVAFTSHHKQLSNGTVKQCASLDDSKKHLDFETKNNNSSSRAHDVLLSGSGESSEICGALAYKCPECNKIQIEIGAIKGENIICPHCLGTQEEMDKAMNHVALEIETDMNAKGSDKFSRGSFPVIQSFISTDNAVPGSSLDCYRKDEEEISLSGTVCPALDAHVHSETLKTCTESQDIKNSVSATHKPRKQKHPRPFALSAFLKGLTEKEETNDFMESFESSDTLEVDAKAETKVFQVKELKQLEVCSDPVNENNVNQFVSFVSTESSGVSGFQRDNNEVCDAEGRTSNHCETGDNNSCQIENSFGELVYERHIAPKDELLAFEEQCLSSCATTESRNDDRHPEKDFFAFPHGSNAWKSFSELHKDFEDFSLTPRKLSMKDICDCIGEQLSNLKLQPGARQNAVGFKSDDALKVAEIKRAVLKKVAGMKSERIEKPDIVKDFMKIISSSKSVPNDDSTTQQQPAKKKGGKKKKGNEGCSDASNWRNRGSDHSDWRSKKTDGDNSRKLVGTAASRHKNNDFDELLREQQRLQEKKKSSGNEHKSNMFNETAIRINSEDEYRVVGRTQSEITIATIEPDTISDRSSIKESGNFVQARSKTLCLFPSARDDRNKAPAQGNPDQECQMLDQMHLEMLRKRKERKEQMAELKRKALSKEEVADMGSTLVSMNDKSESVWPVMKTTVDRGIIRPVENSIEIALGSNKTLGERTQSRGEEQNTNGELAGVCPLIETTVQSGISIINPVESSLENTLDSSNKIDKGAQLRDEEQNLSCDIGPERTSLQKSVLVTHNGNEILPSTSLLASQDSRELRSANDTTDLVCTDKMAAIQDLISTKPNTHCMVMSFKMTCLDLSSESDDLEITLSSCTDVSDISSGLSSDEASEKTRVARKLKFAKESRDVAISSCSKAVIKNESNVEERNKSLKTNPKKPLGKISIPVKSIHSRSKKNTSHKSSKQNRNECVQLNLSNNKSRSQDFLPYRPATHTASSSFPYFDEESYEHEYVNMSLANNECERTKLKRNVQQHCQFHETSEEPDSSDETVDSFDSKSSSSSPNNWWPYWFSLYSHYINNSQRASNYSPFNPYHYQQQQHPYQIPMGPTSWPCYHCHHHAGCHRPRLPPDYADQYGYPYSYYYYDQRAASFQQKYIRHMTHVMHKMSSDKYRK